MSQLILSVLDCDGSETEVSGFVALQLKQIWSEFFLFFFFFQEMVGINNEYPSKFGDKVAIFNSLFFPFLLGFVYGTLLRTTAQQTNIGISFKAKIGPVYLCWFVCFIKRSSHPYRIQKYETWLFVREAGLRTLTNQKELAACF